MVAEIFIDTGAWLALMDGRDGRHSLAAPFYRGIFGKYRLAVTTNLVLAETFVLVRRRCGLQKALSFFEQLDASNRVLTVYSDEALERSAREWLTRFADQDFTLVDAVSFALMKSREIKEAFAFDGHFQVAGFTRRP